MCSREGFLLYGVCVCVCEHSHMCAHVYEERVCLSSQKGGWVTIQRMMEKERDEDCMYREMRRRERALVNKPGKIKAMCRLSLKY